MSRHRARPTPAQSRPSFQTELLEPRRLLAAVYPTAFEQYEIELINRARMDPAAEAARYNINLNEGLSPGSISTLAKQPLAVSPILTDGARTHSQWMLASGEFSHTGDGGSSPGDRMKAAGYDFQLPWTWAENIAWRSFGSKSINTAIADQLQEDLFVDTSIEGRGHRLDMLNPVVREVGAGMLNGAFSGYPHAAMLTTDFATTNGNPFLTGVAYQDTIVKDNFYTPGEGLGGVTITATRTLNNTVFSTTTFPTGGYSLQLPPGTYTIVASGGGLAQPLNLNSITINQQNVKKDAIVTSGVSTPPPADKTPPTATLARALRLRSAERYYSFNVSYADNQALDGFTFDNSDIIVSGPGGFARYANVNPADRGGSGVQRTVNYLIKGPGGSWDAADNGVYTITLRKRQIADAAGNTSGVVALGAFSVKIRGAGVSRALVAAPVITTSSHKKHENDTPVFADAPMPD